MVMQVLILAVQNSVDMKLMGVATSGVTMFRSIGGSVGVSAFGALFTHGLQARMSADIPAASIGPRTFSPDMVAKMPADLHAKFLHAFASSLHVVYHVAAVVVFLGFVLAWFLRDVPLRRAGAKG
jgi:hypothetical protein